MVAVAARRPVGAYVAGCLAGLALSWNLTNTGAIAQTLSRHYAVGLVVVGLLTSIAFFAEFIVMIPGGRAIDRFGARAVAVTSLGLGVATNALLLVVPGIAAALVLRWLLGFGIGAGFVAGSVWITDEPLGRSPLGQGLFGGVSLAGAGLATAIVPVLEPGLGWRASYWSAIVVSLVVLVLALLAPGTRRTGAPEHTPVRELLRKPVIARLGLVHSASFAFSVVSGNWVVTLVRRHLDLGYGAAGAVGGLTLLLGIVGRPFGGWLARRYPQHRYPLLVTALLVAAAGTALLGLSTSVAAAVAGAALLGFACGVPFGACVNAAAASAPNAPGEAVGAMNLYAVTTVIVATPLVGATFGLSGGGRIGFLAVAVLTALAATAVPRR